MRLKKSVVAGLLASAAPAMAQAQQPAPAEDPAPPAPAAEAVAEAADQPVEEDLDADLDEEDDGEEIVVTGQRPRGSVIGDIPPEIQLNRRDIRALGAGSITELLDALAPQTGSTRGRGGERPVTLVNGQRISGFSEIRDLPPEAIERIDILPEEVALKYGYRADQKVVNFVLRRRFRAVTAEAQTGLATAGGRQTYGVDLNMLRINRNGRWSMDAEYEHSTPLFESERDLIQANPSALFDVGEFRTLLAETDRLMLGGTFNRGLSMTTTATANARFDVNSSNGFLGVRGGSILPRGLQRESDSVAGHLGVAVNGMIAPWRWSFTGNYDRASSETLTETGDLRDRSSTETETAGAELVANGSLFKLPGGDISTTIKADFETRSLSSEAVRGGIAQQRDLSRDRAGLQANVDIPIASRRRAFLSEIGNLSANLNFALDRYSDFGTLRTVGYGLIWSPIAAVSLIASVTDEDGAPSMQQLGDPVVLTPGVRVFDFLRGETVDISRLEGGNPDLRADNRRVMKLGLNVRPLSETDLSFSANYTDQSIRNPIASFPTATPEIEAAFPERFVRDGEGRLLRIDSRPVNFLRSERRDLRWGFNFSKRIGPPPPERPAGGWRGRGAGAGGAPRPEGSPEASPGERPAGVGPGVGQRPAGEGRRAGGGRGGRGGFGGGGRGGRVQFALYHNWRIEDRIVIREGVPELDLLSGSAIGSRGGRPRHAIEAQAGLFKNGMGARLTANWESGTKVNGRLAPGGGTTGDLRFSSLATVNLRLFADLGQQRWLARDHPWVRGTRISLNVDNLFDSRIDVRDEAGLNPIGYQPAYLDPLGRSVRLSIRKLFF
jgi:outer membrane cobalamin receptor